MGLLELLVIGLIALVVFGSKKLPELARGLAEATRGFKHAVHEGEQSDVKKPPVTPRTGA